MIPVLSNENQTCTVSSGVLTVGAMIDYKSATERRSSVGKIVGFKYAGYQQENKASVWMLIKDSVENSTEWISCTVWNQQNEKGLFGKPKAVKHESDESANDADLPF